MTISSVLRSILLLSSWHYAKPSNSSEMTYCADTTAATECENVSSESAAEKVSYGVDVSWPIHHEKVSTNYPWLPHNVDPENNPVPEEYKDMPIQPLGDRQSFYDHFYRRCCEHYNKHDCHFYEAQRIDMNYDQPATQTNYTSTGFVKIRAPEKVFQVIKDFWETNKDKRIVEKWPIGYTYTNHWDATTYLLDHVNSSYIGGGQLFRRKLWNLARDTVEEWTGQRLKTSSLYGIRVYTEGSILATHVDRLPLVSSAIINVDQDVDEDWPLEIFGWDGMAHNVTMKPGDMVLYESHTLLHGRPFPLKGRYYANIFIHFEPVDDDSELEEFAPGTTDAHLAARDGSMYYLKEAIEEDRSLVHSKDANGWTPLHEAARTGHVDIAEYLLSQGAKVNELTNDGHTPLYWAKEDLKGGHPIHNFLREKGGVVDVYSEIKKQRADGSTGAHFAARDGDLYALKQMIEKDRSIVHKKDRNGWTALHEAARAGHVDIAEYLLSQGANVNQLTNDRRTPLYWAKELLKGDHPIHHFLQERGGVYL